MVKVRQPRFLTPLVAFTLCMCLTAGSAFFAYVTGRIENQGRFDRSINALIETLNSRMDVYTNALVYTRNLFSVKPDLTAEEFQIFVKAMELKEKYPGIQSIGYISRLKKPEARKLVQQMGLTAEEAGINDDREEHDIIRFLERIHPTTNRVWGMDLSISPERKIAMDQARDMGQAVATDRVIPIMATEDGTSPYAFLVFLPRYRAGMPLKTVEQRRAAHLGFVYSGLRANNLFGRITEDPRFRNAHFALQIFDGRNFDPTRLLYSEGPVDTIKAYMQKDVQFEIANHVWSIRVVAPEEFAIKSLQRAPYFVFLIGFILSLAVAYALRRSRHIATLLQKDIEIREKTEKLLTEARRDADEANRAKSIFLANISHEIRTPLGVMIGFAELAQNQEEQSTRQKSLDTIIRNGRELTRIIGDVLDVSKIEANTLKIETTSFSLKKMLEEIEMIWRPQAESKNLDLQFEMAGDLPAFIMTDEIRLKQILNNLLSNAVKFTSEGFVKLCVSKSSESQLKFVVRDSGIGIPHANRGKLFKAFSQGDSSITRKFGGSGLGLALSLEFAQIMGGKLTLNDSAHEGSEFELLLPYEISQKAQAIPLTKEAISLSGKKILVVDDSEDNRQLISFILEKAKAQVFTANDGSEALEELKKQSFDIVLMDLQMPVMDGYSAIQHIRQQKMKVPVVALTAHALHQEREKALSLGFNAYLTKPIDRHALVNLISDLV